MKLNLKKGEKGFTLVELMVVMAIIAVLAAIVIPPVTGTKQVSSDTQSKQDGSAIQTAVSKHNSDANLAESLTTTTASSGVASGASQVTSNKWAEKAITAAYSAEFAATSVGAITIKDKSGTAISDNVSTFVTKYNAVDFTILETGGYIQQTPSGITATFSTAKPYHNYLWLLKKVIVDGVSNAGRVVEVYSLTAVGESGGTDTLTYQRIF